MLADAPKITDHLCDACGAHFEAVKAHLDARGVPYVLDHRLVRGLDYYMRTAWEFVVDDLGAQGGTIGGGGRYDGLSEQLGGPPAPGIGFGSGIERVLDAMEESAGSQSAPWTAVAVLEPEAGPRVHALLDELRERGVRIESSFGGRSLRRVMEWASKRGADRLVIVGGDEWQRGATAVRDMTTGDQREVPLDRLVEELSG